MLVAGQEPKSRSLWVAEVWFCYLPVFAFAEGNMQKISGQAAPTPFSLRHLPILFSCYFLCIISPYVIYRLYVIDMLSFIYHFKYHRKKYSYTVRKKQKKVINTVDSTSVNQHWQKNAKTHPLLKLSTLAHSACGTAQGAWVALATPLWQKEQRRAERSREEQRPSPILLTVTPQCCRQLRVVDRYPSQPWDTGVD